MTKPSIRPTSCWRSTTWETDEIVDLIEETRCPVPGNLVHTDEAGKHLFLELDLARGRSHPAGVPLSHACSGVSAGETTFDADWTLRYQDVTAGHQGAMFTYLGDGQALVAAFYDERTSFDEETDPWGYVGQHELAALERRPRSSDWKSAGRPRLQRRRVHAGPTGWTSLPDGPRRRRRELRHADLRARRRSRRATRWKLPGWSYQIAQVR